ncbi:MAG TPA: hypothetical protein VFY31_07170 [Macromonas sp.]|nr:hypothetical protein [Macromonas sp.]
MLTNDKGHRADQDAKSCPIIFSNRPIQHQYFLLLACIKEAVNFLSGRKAVEAPVAQRICASQQACRTTLNGCSISHAFALCCHFTLEGDQVPPTDHKITRLPVPQHQERIFLDCLVFHDQAPTNNSKPSLFTRV